ncbi:hypothetical protein [Dawidia soli]|uniref:Uncharacterized protein n=1 Tax=Dawidia soli TaxID=2782352 RepID=A0AAP2DDS1_9BACT|nr:hypothetical protein [Dawidia soli]MBT1688890.1 hypothetical protein [Dawidia soli]
MVAEGMRKIEPGDEYDGLFPKPSWQEHTVKQVGSVEDTMKLIIETVPLDAWQTEKIAPLLKGDDLYSTCRNIWNFVYQHIQYKRDKDGVEQVRSPRLTWAERKKGVDCDCYTKFICSILFNLRIPHLARITKYHKRTPEIPTWQHVYPIVPIDGDLRRVYDRSTYIVLDCVKDAFDDEQPYYQKKDYEMKLDYLDGFEENDEEEVAYEFEDPDLEYETVEAQEMAALYGDLGFLKKLAKKVGSAVKKTVKKVGTTVKTAAKKVGTAVKSAAKEVGDKIGDGIRVINRFVNPVTILLRNGFLLIMKLNMFNIAGKLRYAYLTDAQAQAMNMNLDTLKRLRTVKDRAETVYWQAGGKKENLKKAILKGKGNKDKKVQLSGLFGIDDVYMDMDEYNIIHADPDNLSGLGEVASGTAIAAATSAAAAIAAALKQIKGLFNKGGADEAAFQSETDNAGTATDVAIPEDEDAITEMDYYAPTTTLAPTTAATNVSTLVPVQPAIPSAAVARRIEDTGSSVPATTSASSAPAATGNESTKGFLSKATTWVKENPGKTLVIVGAAASLLMGARFLVKESSNGNPKERRSNGMNGLPNGAKRRKKKKRKGNHRNIKSITF